MIDSAIVSRLTTKMSPSRTSFDEDHDQEEQGEQAREASPSCTSQKPKTFSPFSVDSLLAQKESKSNGQPLLKHCQNSEANRLNNNHKEAAEDRIKVDVCGDSDGPDDLDDEEDDEQEKRSNSPHISHPTPLHHPRFLAGLLGHPGHPAALGFPSGPLLAPPITSATWMPQFRSPGLAQQTGSEYFAPRSRGKLINLVRHTQTNSTVC